MSQPIHRNMHRKFIALVLSASLAITGFAAAPARADEDVAKVLAGLAFLAILGAAIKDSNASATQPVHVHPAPRPLPPRVARYDLPSQCVKYYPRYKNGRNMVSQRCLSGLYGQMNSLPNVCRVSFWNGRNTKVVYEPTCLKQKGYRMVRY